MLRRGSSAARQSAALCQAIGAAARNYGSVGGKRGVVSKEGGRWWGGARLEAVAERCIELAEREEPAALGYIEAGVGVHDGTLDVEGGIRRVALVATHVVVPNGQQPHPQLHCEWRHHMLMCGQTGRRLIVGLSNEEHLVRGRALECDAALRMVTLEHDTDVRVPAGGRRRHKATREEASDGRHGHTRHACPCGHRSDCGGTAARRRRCAQIRARTRPGGHRRAAARTTPAAPADAAASASAATPGHVRRPSRVTLPPDEHRPRLSALPLDGRRRLCHGRKPQDLAPAQRAFALAVAQSVDLHRLSVGSALAITLGRVGA
eukprot:scaffold106389_cov27-Tisochrysis_lutea.AAC.2